MDLVQSDEMRHPWRTGMVHLHFTRQANSGSGTSPYLPASVDPREACSNHAQPPSSSHEIGGLSMPSEVKLSK